MSIRIDVSGIGTSAPSPCVLLCSTTAGTGRGGGGAGTAAGTGCGGGAGTDAGTGCGGSGGATGGRGTWGCACCSETLDIFFVEFLIGFSEMCHMRVSLAK